MSDFFEKLKQNPNVRDCCKTKGNLIESGKKGELLIYKCKICGRNHFRLFAETGRMFTLDGNKRI